MLFRGLRGAEILLLLGFLAAGTWLRAIDIADRPLQVDEAESTINALTILEHGYPSDHYMGLPIYENTLSVPWPESEEYEFKDSSYSEAGVAIYHAWLPLYSIAAALKLAGIEPDPPTDSLRPRHEGEALGFRTLVPRLPSLFFSLVFMLAMFGLGRATGGPVGGWTVLLLASCTEVVVNLGSPARYYSATMALSALAGLTLWQLATQHRRRDYLAHGTVMALLFHTHALSCLVLGVLSLSRLPRLARDGQGGWRAGFLPGAVWCGGVFLLGVVPWILATGFPGDAGAIPKAWEVMELPGDLLTLSGQRLSQLIPIALGVAWVVVARAFGSRLPGWATNPVLAHAGALLHFFLWGALAFFAFSFLIPLISYFPARMSMMLAAPKLLFIGVLISGVLTHGLRVRQQWVAPLAALALLIGSGRTADLLSEHEIEQSALPIIAEYFAEEDFASPARLYTEPNQQLPLQYVLGLPAQSIAPVRKSFLDAYPGEIVFLDWPQFAPEWTAERVEDLLGADDPRATAVAREITIERVREDILAQGGRVQGPEARPIAVPDAVRQARNQEAQRPLRGWWTGIPAFFGFEVRDHDFAWKVFFYRFVDPLARSGAGANYAERLRGASARILPGRTGVVYRAPLQSGAVSDR